VAPAEPEAAEPEITEAEDSQPEITQPEVVDSEAAQSEITSAEPAPQELQAAAPENAPLEEPVGPVGAADLRTGTWVELSVNKKWTRMQLTWASPHGTLFMFTSLSGSAHSMSRRTLERLRADGTIRIVAERNVVDEALDEVAKAALKNSLENKGQ
jgi:hypothetical protein